MSTKAKLLIVDDDESIREILHFAFHETRDVFAASNAFDALRLKEEHEIRLLLTDIQMPGMSGIDLCEKIRKYDSSSILYAMTGNPDLFAAACWSKFGFNGCFFKPFEISEIKNAVERVDQVLRKREARVKEIAHKQKLGCHHETGRQYLDPTRL